ncbi:MAG: stage IV sporulation protein A [Sakamotonia sp.]|jgi:stage IV sporulation protein A
MDNFQVYKDIEARTGGEIYIGVTGPVRTGKSTFIKRFMELMVLPRLPEGHGKAIARDELPQSAAGKTIMTTEPKFIPKEAAELSLEDGITARVRLVDCVGFMVEGAAGHEENGEERLVKTPWYDHEIPFTQAAEIGTRKVIRDHSTIGIAVTADGSFGELKRSDYLDAENETIRELKEIGKPFVMLLNSARPYAEETRELAQRLEKDHGITVLPMNCEQLKKEDIETILATVLTEFPVTELRFHIPRWMEILPEDHPLKAAAIESAREILKRTDQMKDVGGENLAPAGEGIREMTVSRMEMANGTVEIQVKTEESCYFKVISEFSGVPVRDEYELFHTMARLSSMESEYEKVKNALSQVRARGYGIVMPQKSEIVLEEPELIRHGNKYGIKIHAQAPSINLIKAHIETEIAPIVGSEEQARDLIAYIKKSAQKEDGVWETSIFGKSVEQIVEDGMEAKISQMTEDCQAKLQDTLQKIINDSNGGMICIII